MPEIVYGRGYVYALQYHIVWCVKYRRKVLVNEVEQSFRQLLTTLCEEHDILIDEMEVDQDHIHLLVSLKPQHYIPTVMKTLKGHSARRLFLVHPEIKASLWGGHLWNPSYFIATVSEQTEQQIRHYIQTQKVK